MVTEYYQYGFSFQAGPRKLLAVNEDPLPVAAAPGPIVSCRDLKSGQAAASCNPPHTLVMVLAGMLSMMFLICVALALLCWSVVRQRRLNRRAQTENPTASPLPQVTASAQNTVPVDSLEFDDAVLVQLPGDEKPHFFALPKPFPLDGEQTDVAKLKVEDSAVDDDHNLAGHEKLEAESEPPDDAPPDHRPALS